VIFISFAFITRQIVGRFELMQCLVKQLQTKKKNNKTEGAVVKIRE